MANREDTRGKSKSTDKSINARLECYRNVTCLRSELVHAEARPWLRPNEQLVAAGSETPELTCQPKVHTGHYTLTQTVLGPDRYCVRELWPLW